MGGAVLTTPLPHQLSRKLLSVHHFSEAASKDETAGAANPLGLAKGGTRMGGGSTGSIGSTVRQLVAPQTRPYP